MFLGRSESEEGLSNLPNEWIENVVKVLNEAYSDTLEKENRFFDVYGQMNAEEVVLVISYIHHTDQLESPISLFISHDIGKSSKETKKILSNLIDLTGEIFDHIFSEDDWQDYTPNWTENKFRDDLFFYKTTRENISLSFQADQILSGTYKM